MPKPSPTKGGLRQYLRMLARQPVSATLLSSSPQAPDFTDDELCEALESGRGMRVDLQPQFDLRTRRIVGAEALIRWRHTGPGDVPVSAMLPVVSRLGLDGLLFGYVRDQVIETLRLLQSHGRCVPIAINISAATLSQPGLISLLGERVREVGLGPELIKIELTEDAAPLDELSLSTALNCLRAEGFLLSLDDFGTGSASFELLADIPFDELKVAGKFVRDVAQRESCRAILAALSRLGRALNMCLVAECVETEADIACLRRLGVQVGQGYALCRPISAPDFLGRMMQQE
ncbi:EAL domain-containing protein [Bordetella avium]|uniref:EAL domain-containing protein n=1 Tax=Bordetella avium TaxID=521 RepID=UPI0013051270|nr:EAL domain-containing protein [Bordetella avium]